MTLVDTGENTMTGGRLKRVRDYIGGETFCFTYGDGVADLNVRALIDFHAALQALATVTAVRHRGASARSIEAERRDHAFREKSHKDVA